MSAAPLMLVNRSVAASSARVVVVGIRPRLAPPSSPFVRLPSIPPVHPPKTASARRPPSLRVVLARLHRRVDGGHRGAVAGVVVDGEHVLTAGWDGELIAWSDADAPPRRACIRAQRVDAHDAPCVAVARVAAGWILTGGVDGEVRAFTTAREPGEDGEEIAPRLFPPAPEPAPEAEEAEEATEATEATAEDAENADENADGGDGGGEGAGDAEPEPEPEPASSPPPPPPPSREDEELRDAIDAAATARAAYDGPWRAATGSAFSAGAGRVHAILPLHRRAHEEDKERPGRYVYSTPYAPPDEEALPPRVAIAMSAATCGARGNLTHVVRIINLEAPGTAVEQDLTHPEGVTCMLRRYDDYDGKDRIVTGCLDGRVRVWAGTPPPPPPEAEAEAETGEGEEGEPTPRKTDEEDSDDALAPYRFELEATLDGHAGRAVSCLAWLGEHAACPPPRPTPKPIVDEATGIEISPGEPPEEWEDMDASAYFLSGGGDGSVRVWARRRVVEEKAAAAATATDEENEAAADADGDAAAAAAAEPTEPPPPTYGWSADPRVPDIATAPIAARLVTSVDAATLDVKGVGVKALLVAREKISAGLSDGRVATYGYRDLDGSGDQIWVLERVMEASGGRKSAVTSMTACGHNMLLCAADEGAYLYA